MEAYEELEEQLRKWSGCNDVVVCSSGTAALHLALEAFQLKPGSRVLMPDYTMVACARAVSMAGLQPIFVDCDYNLLMSRKCTYDALESSNVSAIMGVHVYGRELDFRGIIDNSNGAIVIEDLAEGHGIKPSPYTDASCWSFYKNKIVHGEEGGAIGFKDLEVSKYARCLRSLGFTEQHDFTHVPRGHNYRMSNLHAVPILQSLSMFETSLKIRRAIETEYNNRCPGAWRMPHRDVVWVYDLRIPGLKKEEQDSIVSALNEVGIRARHGFKPMSLQEEYRMYAVFGGNTHNAYKMMNEVIYLPCDPHMLPDIDIVATRAFLTIYKVLDSFGHKYNVRNTNTPSW